MLPPTFSELTVDIFVLERVLGTKDLVKVEKIIPGETLLLHLGVALTTGKVKSVKGQTGPTTSLELSRTVCVQPGSRLAVSRKIAGRWRLIGYGTIR